MVGFWVVGCSVGEDVDGDVVGEAVVGKSVGDDVVGDWVGSLVGRGVGAKLPLGGSVGAAVAM